MTIYFSFFARTVGTILASTRNALTINDLRRAGAASCNMLVINTLQVGTVLATRYSSRPLRSDCSRPDHRRRRRSRGSQSRRMAALRVSRARGRGTDSEDRGLSC